MFFFLEKLFFYFVFIMYLILFLLKMDLGFFLNFMESSMIFGIIYLSFLVLVFLDLLELNFFVLMLSFILLVFMIFFFQVGNFLLFFVFFEFSSFPVIILTLLFGLQVEKIRSLFYLIFYMILSGYFFLVLVLKLIFFFKENILVYFSMNFSVIIFFFFSISFLMKFPVYFFHFWLPKMHVEASTVGSMLLAGLLLKLGVFGFLRLIYLLNYFCIDFFLFLGILSMVFCSMLCFMQSDMKSLVAYSSIVHMGLVFEIMLILSNYSVCVSILMIISHGLVSVMAFFFMGLLSHKIGSRLIYMNFGFFYSLVMVMFLMLVFLMNSNIPLTLGFYSEMMSIFVFIFLKSFIFFLLLYMFLSFYFSLMLLVNLFLGKSKFIFSLKFWMMMNYFFFNLMMFFFLF